MPGDEVPVVLEAGARGAGHLDDMPAGSWPDEMTTWYRSRDERGTDA
ncbi:MAG TPA: hypothetical protein VFN61_16910 [Acidimicrobiales bacterium]|nr:hypothetical protein [Acidimicrobiales bacterium]